MNQSLFCFDNTNIRLPTVVPHLARGSCKIMLAVVVAAFIAKR